MKVALAQIAPVLLDREATEARILDAMSAAKGAHLIVFGEGLLPGYPFWVERTDGARFDSARQKDWYARYLRAAIDIESGGLKSIQERAASLNLAVYLGIMERPQHRGGHSLYASLVYIDAHGEIASVHRKLMPTYEERLVWSPGDGAGLVAHDLGDFRVGGLNCWENWMPLARAALYAQGVNLHIAVWPGNRVNTEWITRFIARESRSYVVSVSGLMRREDLASSSTPDETWHGDVTLANGGSCVAAPDGDWLLEPIVNESGVFTVDLDLARVLEERQNFDPSGHYARPDVLALSVNRQRLAAAQFSDDPVSTDLESG
ncbi:MAG: carbon-nitrogen hydrolase family protein [Pseudomonadota bacterium]